MAADLEEQLRRTTTSQLTSTETRVVPTAQDLAATMYDLLKVQKITSPEHIGRGEKKLFKISSETQQLYAGTMMSIYKSFASHNLTSIPHPTTEEEYINNAIISFVKNFKESAQLQPSDQKTDLSSDEGIRKHAFFLLSSSDNKEQWLMTAFTLSQWELMTLQKALRAEINPLKNYPNKIDTPRQALRTSPHGSSQGPVSFSDLAKLSIRQSDLLFQAAKNGLDSLRTRKYISKLFGKGEMKTYDIQYYRLGSSAVTSERDDLQVDYGSLTSGIEKDFIRHYFNGQQVQMQENGRNVTKTLFSDLVVGGSPREPGGLKVRETEHLLQLMAARDEMYFAAGMNTARPPALVKRNGAIFQRGDQMVGVLTFNHESFEASGTKKVIRIEQQVSATMEAITKEIDSLRKETEQKRTAESVKSIVGSRLAEREVKVKSLNEKGEIVEVSEKQDQFDIDYALSEIDLKARIKLEQELQRLKERKGYAEEKKKMEEELDILIARQEHYMNLYKSDAEVRAKRPELLREYGKELNNLDTIEIDRLEKSVSKLEEKAREFKSGGQTMSAEMASRYREEVADLKAARKRKVYLEEQIQRLTDEESKGIFEAKYISGADELVPLIEKKKREIIDFETTHGDRKPAQSGSSTPLFELRSVAEYEKDILEKEKQIREFGPDAYWKDYKRGAYQAAEILFTADKQMDIIKAAKKLETADDKAAIVKAMLDVRDPRYKDYPPAYLITLQMLYGDDIIGPGKYENFNKAVSLLPPNKWLDLVGSSLGIPISDLSHSNTLLFANSSAERMTYSDVRHILDALVTEVKNSDRFGLPEADVEQYCEEMRLIQYANIDFTQLLFKQILESLLSNRDLYYFINEEHLAVLILDVLNGSSTSYPLSPEEAKTLAREYMKKKRVTGTVNITIKSSSAPGATPPAPPVPPPVTPLVSPSTPTVSPVASASSTAPTVTTPAPAPTVAPSSSPPPPTTSVASSTIPVSGPAAPELLMDVSGLRVGVESRGANGSLTDIQDVALNVPAQKLYGLFDGGRVGDKAKETADVVAEAIREQDAVAGELDLSVTSIDEYMQGLMQLSETEVDGMSEHGVVAGVVVKLFETPAGIQAGIVNAGDCRVYLFRDGKLEQVTEDHYFDETKDMDTIKDRIKQIAAANSYTIDPAEVDALTPDKIKRKLETFNTVSTDADFGADTIARTLFKLKDELQFGIGSADLALSTKVLPVNKGDRLLITTDGVHDNLSLNELESYMVASSATTATARLIIENAQVRAGTKGIRNRKDDTSAVIIAV